MNKSKKKLWIELTHIEKGPYLAQAFFQKGYTSKKDLYTLAETIYNRSSE